MRVYRVWLLIVLALVIIGVSINLYSGLHGIVRYHQAPSPVTDCRLGPHDCGYADNGRNSDR